MLLCSLVDIRYYPLSTLCTPVEESEDEEEPVPFAQFLFAACDVGSNLGGPN